MVKLRLWSASKCFFMKSILLLFALLYSGISSGQFVFDAGLSYARVTNGDENTLQYANALEYKFSKRFSGFITYDFLKSNSNTIILIDTSVAENYNIIAVEGYNSDDGYVLAGERYSFKGSKILPTKTGHQIYQNISIGLNYNVIANQSFNFSLGSGILAGYIEREYIAAIIDGSFESIFYPTGPIKAVFPYYLRKTSLGYLFELKPTYSVSERLNIGLSFKIINYLDGDSLLLAGIKAGLKL